MNEPFKQPIPLQFLSLELAARPADGGLGAAADVVPADGGLVGAAADVVPALSSLLLIIVVLPTISRVLWAIGLVGIIVHTK